jgi:hypothetical protein
LTFFGRLRIAQAIGEYLVNGSQLLDGLRLGLVGEVRQRLRRKRNFIARRSIAALYALMGSAALAPSLTA